MIVVLLLSAFMIVECNLPLQLSIEPPGQFIFSGTNVTMTCEFSDDQIQGEYTFIHNGKAVPGTNGKTYTMKASSTSSGTYNCIGKKRGPGSTNQMLSLPSRIIVLQPPKLIASGVASPLLPGGRVFLTCTLYGISRNNWTNVFFHNGEQINNGNDLMLELSPLKLIDSGNYTCKAKVGGDSARSNVISLNVLGPPKLSITPSGPNVAAGSNVVFAVRHNWNQTGIKYEIYYGNKLISRDERLEIRDVKLINSGNYTVNISNGNIQMGSVVNSILVLEKPRIKTDPPEGELTPGKDIVMKCALKATNSEVRYTFFHDTNLLQEGTRRKYILRDAGFDRSGEYLCTAQYNGFRSLESEKRTIIITGCPTPIGSSEYNRRLLDSITPPEETTRWGKKKMKRNGDL